jgi:hypothetical protein
MFDPTSTMDNGREITPNKLPEKMPNDLPEGACLLRIEFPIFIPGNIFGKERAARATRIISDALQKLINQKLVIPGGKAVAHVISGLETTTIESSESK